MDHKKPMSLTTFKRGASLPQLRILDAIIEASQREAVYARNINFLTKELENGPPPGIWGSHYFYNVRELASDLHEEYGYLVHVRREMAGYFQQAVEFGMGCVGLIQRHYASYVGKKLPVATTKCKKHSAPR